MAAFLGLLRLLPILLSLWGAVSAAAIGFQIHDYNEAQLAREHGVATAADEAAEPPTVWQYVQTAIPIVLALLTWFGTLSPQFKALADNLSGVINVVRPVIPVQTPIPINPRLTPAVPVTPANVAASPPDAATWGLLQSAMQAAGGQPFSLDFVVNEQAINVRTGPVVQTTGKAVAS